MPELPEVETIKRTLASKVEGRVITHVDILLGRVIKWPTPEKFQAVVTGKKIIRAARKGKYLLFHLENDLVMVVHLRMTGRLYYTTADVARDPFTRIVFTLDNSDILQYADVRTLGTLYVLPLQELQRISGLWNLGPEPLSDEFTVAYFKNTIRKRKGKIKSLLLNQQIIGGLGNIYVDESLAVAGIHPERNAFSLSDAEIETLHQAINQVISAGIQHGGTTFRDYRDGTGGSGKHQNYLRVYGRKDQPCLKCGSPIIKIEVGGRGTHFCPNCQH